MMSQQNWTRLLLISEKSWQKILTIIQNLFELTQDKNCIRYNVQVILKTTEGCARGAQAPPWIRQW